MKHNQIINNPDDYFRENFEKDCPNNNYVPTILPSVERIIAIGDIHGDLNLAIKSFKLAQLIDDEFNWIASPLNTIVVQVGDQIDSCRPIEGLIDCHNQKLPGDKSDDINVMIFFDMMHNKASKHGGAVYSLLGNHELMNTQGNFDYVSYENYHNFYYDSPSGEKYTGSLGRQIVFKPGSNFVKKMACNRLSVLVIGSTMFTHAGVLPVLAQKLDKLDLDSDKKLEYLNMIVRKWLLNRLSGKQDEEYKSLFINDTKISPFWNRIYGMIPNNTSIDSDQCFNSVKKTLQVFKIGKIVVGHTPQLFTNKDGINGTCYERGEDNKLYRIDGGFADAFNAFNKKHVVQVLEITDDKYFRIITSKKN